MTGVSALILTKNEAGNLPKCLASLAWCSDVVVFDSESNDGTPDLARQFGARVFTRPFDDYSRQREAARIQVDWRHEWVLTVDADECVDAELASEIPRAIASASSDVAAFRVRRKDFFQGRWIKNATLYPSWHIRLFRHARVTYPPRTVHEYPDVDGRIEALHGHLIHDNFSKGLAHWWERHVRYAAGEAAEAFAEAAQSVDWSGFLSTDPVRRRRALKRLSYRLPCRPLLRYLYMMYVRKALLDGQSGWTYCRMIADYQRITDHMLRDLRRQARQKRKLS